MKVMLSVISALLLLTSALQAGELSIGAKAGFVLNDARFTSDYDLRDSEPDRGSGSAFVLQIEKQLPKPLALRLEAAWIQKGYGKDIEGGYGYESDHINSRVNYFCFALLARANIAKGMYAVAGPRVDLKSSVIDKESDFLFPERDDYLKSYVFGLTVGVGQELAVGDRGAIFVEIQLQYDLTPAYDATSNRELTDGSFNEIYNRAVLLLLGYRI